jgi:5-methylcytosine-specific restriction endonuclease McrA
VESIDGTTTNDDEETPRNDVKKPIQRRALNHKDLITIWQNTYGELFSGTCKLCLVTHIQLGERRGDHAWEVSHIIPFSRGGSESVSNLRPLCRGCNRRMGRKTFMEYIELNFPHRKQELLNSLNLPRPT